MLRFLYRTALFFFGCLCVLEVVLIAWASYNWFLDEEIPYWLIWAIVVVTGAVGLSTTVDATLFFSSKKYRQSVLGEP